MIPKKNNFQAFESNHHRHRYTTRLFFANQISQNQDSLKNKEKLKNQSKISCILTAA